MSRVLKLLVLLAALLPLPARAAATPWVGDAHAAARLITAEAATGSAGRLDAGLEFRLATGWHIYWRTPGDAGFPPVADWRGSDNVAAAGIAWPAPRRLVVSGLQNAIFSDHVVLPVSIGLAHPGRPARLHAELDYAACAQVCVPYHASLNLAVPAGLAGAAPEAPLIAAARRAVPGDPAGAGLRVLSATVAADAGGAALAVMLASEAGRLRAPDLFVEGIPQTAPGPPVTDLDDDGQRARLWVALPGMAAASVARRPLTFTVVDGARAAEFTLAPKLGALPDAPGSGWAAMLAVALLGGLVLNAMPCVLPVLALKLLALTSHAGDPRRKVRTGLLATAAGVLLSFAVLAAALIGLRAAGAAVGWGIQFQQPWFLAAMAAITALFAASLWDLLPIGIPGLSAVAGVRSRHRVLDAVLTGAFVTLLATPCSAPFVGTAVGFALARGPAQILAVFAALGLGMAFPYLLAAAIPATVRLLPRPGPWMHWLRRAMGVLLAGTAVWLLAVLGWVVQPWLAVVAGSALLLAILALAVRGRPAMRASRLGLLAAMLAGIAVLVPTLGGPAPPAADRHDAAASWRSLDVAAIPALVAQGKTVLVDVTAAWCLTCKVNALAVLDRDPVAARMRLDDHVAMRADWTRPDPSITAYLQSFGRFGVPLDVIYGPGRAAGIALPELLSTRAVTDALREAEAPDSLAAR